jgi:uncharacterized membrane protein YfcA
MTNPIVLVLFGVFVGVFSGIMGLGGGAIMIPIMVLLMGLNQTQAHGMSLAVMIPPVTLPAVIAYYRNGKLEPRDILMAMFIAAGFACGSFFGGWFASSLPKDTLKLVFGFVLVYIAGYTIFSWFGSEHLTRTVTLAGVLVIVTVVIFVWTKWHDARGVVN